MTIQGIRYSYSDGGSVDIKYPRQKFEQGGPALLNVKSPYMQQKTAEEQFGTPQASSGFFIVDPNGNQQPVNASGQVANQPQGNQGGTQIQQSGGGGTEVPQVQAGGGGGGSSGGGGGNAASGVFGEVATVYNDLRQNTAENQSVANSIFNRNVARKNLAMSEATTASNLRGAGQSQQQNAIQFGEQQSDRAGQLKTAAAWAQGVSRGLTSGRT